MGRVAVMGASVDDIDELMAWRMEVLREVFPVSEDDSMEDLERRNRNYYVKALSEGAHVACFARADGETVGCGGVCLHTEMPSPDNPSGKCAYLMNIYTRPRYQGRGVGSAVVNWLIEEARKRGAEKVYLETSDAGRRLYEKVGFSDMDGYMKLEEQGKGSVPRKGKLA